MSAEVVSDWLVCNHAGFASGANSFHCPVGEAQGGIIRYGSRGVGGGWAGGGGGGYGEADPRRSGREVPEAVPGLP